MSQDGSEIILTIIVLFFNMIPTITKITFTQYYSQLRSFIGQIQKRSGVIDVPSLHLKIYE